MESPRTFTGYGQDGSKLISRTGRDANQDINPQEVQSAIENVKTVFAQEMSSLANSLMNISSDAEDSVVVQGTNMGATIEETATLITQVPDSVMAGIDSLYEYAVQAHDSLQSNYNNAAYNECVNTNGVVSIS